MDFAGLTNTTFLEDISLSDGMLEIGLTVEELSILRIVSRVLSGFSISGLVFVQIIFWCFRSIRTFALELIAWLCFSSILFNISDYFPFYESDSIASFNNKTLSESCSAQAFINIMFDLSSMIWTTIIGYTAYISVADQERLNQNKMRYRILFLFLAYILPCGFALIVLLTHTYGPSGVFCWIASQTNLPSVRALIIIYYSFTWVIILFNCFFVIKVIYLLKEELGNEQELMDRYTSKLKWYPLVQIISFIPCTLNRIYNLTTGTESFYLLLLQVVADSLTGLMFSIVYGFNASVKKTVSELLNAICCRKKKQQVRNSLQSNGENNMSPNRLSKSLTFISDTITDT